MNVSSFNVHFLIDTILIFFLQLISKITDGFKNDCLVFPPLWNSNMHQPSHDKN